MLFILFVFIYSCFRGVIITDITTFGKCVGSTEIVPFIIALIVIIIIYTFSFFRIKKREDAENLADYSLSIIIAYGVIGIIVSLITASKSEQLCNTVMWWYAVLWPLVTLVIMIIIERKKKVSYLDCIFKFLYLEVCMIGYITAAAIIIIEITVKLVFVFFLIFGIFGGDRD